MGPQGRARPEARLLGPVVELLLAVEGKDRFQFGNAFMRFDDMDKCAEAASDLRQVLSVIDFVLAGPPRAPELAPA